jgi:hypothetical protein
MQVMQCARTEAGATRQGILVTIGFYAWGAVHYLLASFGMASRMAKADAARAAGRL